jgi:hypothetical protein
MKLRGRVSKYVTNGSNTAVMNAIGFPYVSIGSSTVHIHDSLGSGPDGYCLGHFCIYMIISNKTV